MRKPYFPNLNGLRFIAAFGVIIHHIEQYKYILHEPNRWHIPFFDPVGKICVVLFFVLSGFLITYLLLDERAATGRVAVGSFYLRRVRRIWPVYYLLVFLGLFVFPALSIFYLPGLSEALSNGFVRKALLLLLILPNLVTVPIPMIFQTWSIGVEEQFYLLWPLLLRKTVHPIRICLIVLGGYLFIQFGVIPLLGYLTHEPGWLLTIAKIWQKFSIDCMAIGGIAAVILHRRYDRILNWLFSKPVQYGTYALSGFMVAYGVVIPYLNFECYAILFAIIILNLAANPHSILTLEYRWLTYLGKISYGLYMYHLAAIAIAHYLTSLFVPGSDSLLYSLSIGLTIAIAAVSYEGFERRFLRLGNRHTAPKKQHLEPVDK